MSDHDEHMAKVPDQAIVPVPRRLPLCAAVAVLLASVGALAMIGNFGMLVHRVFLDDQVPWHEVPWRFQIWDLELRLFAMLVGVALIGAGQLFSVHRWKSGMVVACSAFVAASVHPAVNRALRHHFAGDSFDVASPAGETRREIWLASPAGIGDDDATGLRAPFDESAARNAQLECARLLGRQPVERNTIGMDLVLIPKGEFDLGSRESLAELEQAFPIIAINARNPDFRRSVESECPQTKVRITHAFYIGRTNLTVGQFQLFVDDTGYLTEAEKDGRGGGGYTPGDTPALSTKPTFNWRNTGFSQQDDSPVVNVTWNDAQAFCDWLSVKESRSYRLPTDAEWEYACRAGSVTRYSVGDDPNVLIAAANVADFAYFRILVGEPLSPENIERGASAGVMLNGDDGYAFTSPVGRFKPNAFGLYDMHGNASTWCLDGALASARAGAVVLNPRGMAQGPTRVVRGGNWQFYPSFCRSAARFGYRTTAREPFLGFRVVYELSRD